MLTYIIPFLILILVVVFIHEYGHYYFAKKYGVGVTDFSIGFGKEIFGWNDKSGTRWKICWIPLGGYVKFFGDRNVFSQADHEKILKQYNKEDQEKLFVIKPLYQRALIVFGGPLANFILAIAIFFCIYTFVGKDFTPAVINEVQKDSPAMIGGLKNNDIILEIDGNKVESIMDVSKFITTSIGDVIDFKVERSNQEYLLKIKPNIVLSDDNLGNKINKRMVGIQLGAYNNEINHVKLGTCSSISSLI
jgi:regulator of sigma E protease